MKKPMKDRYIDGYSFYLGFETDWKELILAEGWFPCYVILEELYMAYKIYQMCKGDDSTLLPELSESEQMQLYTFSKGAFYKVYDDGDAPYAIKKQQLVQKGLVYCDGHQRFTIGAKGRRWMEMPLPDTLVEDLNQQLEELKAWLKYVKYTGVRNLLDIDHIESMQHAIQDETMMTVYDYVSVIHQACRILHGDPELVRSMHLEKTEVVTKDKDLEGTSVGEFLSMMQKMKEMLAQFAYERRLA